MNVRMVDLARLHAPIREAIDAAIARVVGSGRFILGAEVDAFEREMAAFLGVTRAVAVSSGSDALLCGLAAEGVRSGDEVIVPGLSFIATAEAVSRLGATPVFADVDVDGNLDAASALARRTPRTRAIVTVDLFGRRSNVDELARSGVPVVVDAAQAIGRSAGDAWRRARSSAISFFPTKNLGAFGDGGLVATDSERVAEVVRSMRSHASSTTNKYVHERIGWNMRLDALQAAVLRVKLPHLDGWNAARARIAAQYREAFADLGWLTLPSNAPDHAWHQFVVRADARDALRAHLAERGVETEVYYPLALHLQPCFAELGGRPGDLPKAEAFTRKALALPIHPMLDDREIDHVIASVRAFPCA
jgi:dTDP-4-amino-4,6-dideoxygalactose transaminase